MRTIFDLLFTFMKIGFFTFGGGYAMLSVIEDNCVEKKKWITHDDMMNVTVIAESTPGPIAINCATFIGYRQAGILGSIAATVGIVLPSFAVILIISGFLDNFLEIEVVKNAFRGIKCAVGILIVSAAVTMIKKMKKKTFPIAVMVLSALAMLATDLFSFGFSAITIIVFAALLGLSVFAVKRIKERRA
ncbi:chromate transporter [bacterium]|nr:chromate transporter [bacterium]MBP5592073.1 chromate transporter [bacterium]